MTVVKAQSEAGLVEIHKNTFKAAAKFFGLPEHQNRLTMNEPALIPFALDEMQKPLGKLGYELIRDVDVLRKKVSELSSDPLEIKKFNDTYLNDSEDQSAHLALLLPDFKILFLNEKKIQNPTILYFVMQHELRHLHLLERESRFRRYYTAKKKMEEMLTENLIHPRLRALVNQMGFANAHSRAFFDRVAETALEIDALFTSIRLYSRLKRDADPEIEDFAPENKSGSSKIFGVSPLHALSIEVARMREINAGPFDRSNI